MARRAPDDAFTRFLRGSNTAVRYPAFSRRNGGAFFGFSAQLIMSDPAFSKPENLLLARVREGDRAAFGELYDRFSTALFSLAMRILRDQKQAEDLIQEVFLQVWRKADQFDPERGSFITWSMMMTRNLALDRIRKIERHARLVEELTAEAAAQGEDAPALTENLDLQDRVILLKSAMAKLPPEQKRLIELAFFDGLTQSEISDLTKEPLGTVKARIRRGLLKLREALQDNERKS
jgi:RNA polymerase sigma-70 factor (ECF subfamily)